MTVAAAGLAPPVQQKNYHNADNENQITKVMLPVATAGTAANIQHSKQSALPVRHKKHNT